MNITTRNYESLLPFLVVEAISAHKQSTFGHMSVRMMDQGWAWLICGRRYLVWKFKETKPTDVAKFRRMLSPCFELALPQSSVVHRADLMDVFFLPQNPNASIRSITLPAAIAVSPEGTVRFWSSVANERFTESSVVDFQGQEFCTLAHLSALEFLLGTTTGSIYIFHIDLASHDPKNILVTTALTATSSLLSGIGRRMTNLFFGPTIADNESKRPLIAVPKFSQSTIDQSGSSSRPFFVMSSTFKLRHWSRAKDGPVSENELIREWDLQKLIYDRFVSIFKLSESDRFSFWPVDMITSKSREVLLILIVTLNATRDNIVNYATCTFNPYQAGSDIRSLTLMKSHSWHYSNESEESLLSLRFLERRTKSQVCFVYDKKLLFLIDSSQDILDAIDYGNQQDEILGAGMIDDHPILFTQRDGLIYVAPAIKHDHSRLNETSIQLDHPPISADESRITHRSRRDQSRMEPMIVEIDIEDDDSMADDRTSVSRLSIQHSSALENSHQTTINNSVDQSNHQNRSQAEPTGPKRKDGLSEILKENHEFEWILHLDSKNYIKASETLDKLAQGCELLNDRKETLVALSKLAKLAE